MAHKVMAVYMTLGEILPRNRSTVDPAPFALQRAGFQVVWSGLKYLDLGLLLDDGNNLTAVCGDNLGFHFAGGLTEYFSSSKNLCRW